MICQAEILDIWNGLLTANVAVLQGNNLHTSNIYLADLIWNDSLDAGDDNGTSRFAVRTVEILIEILQDSELDFTQTTSTEIPTSPVKGFKSSPRRSQSKAPPPRSNATLKLSVIRDLWSTTRTAIPHNLLSVAGQKFIAMLTQNDSELVPEIDPEDDARKQWSLLCAEVLVVCDLGELRSFWGSSADEGKQQVQNWTLGMTNVVWGSFIEGWRQDGGESWEGAAVLLSVPFA